jgi:uncharacterized protein YqgV (UPF0045/DUF77 family)
VDLTVALDVEPAGPHAASPPLTAAIEAAQAAGLVVAPGNGTVRVAGERGALLAALPEITAAAVAAGASRVTVLLQAPKPG